MGTPLRTWLYRRAGVAVIWLAAFVIVPAGSAQFAAKNTQSKGPRALGLLELYTGGKARLRPICIMIDGRFYDAGIYKADPVPMALDSGIVYEAERAGESAGLFTIRNVLQNEARRTFVAEGSWVPAGSEPAKTVANKSAAKPKEDEDDKPPVLRRPGSEPVKDKPAADTKPAETKPTSTTSDDDDSDRPRLHKPAASTEPGNSAGAPTQAGTGANTQAADTTPSTSPDENDPNRPHLRRGAPPPTSRTATEPEPTKPAVLTPSAKSPAVNTTAPKNETQLLPAISDADGPEPRPYTYPATPKEEEQFRSKVLALAAQDLLKTAKELEPGSVPNAERRVGRIGKGTTTKAAAVAPVWDDVQMKVFDVATSNEPVLVLTAKGHLPVHAKEGGASAASPVEFYVTEVAHSDLYGELRRLFTAVTDDRTLDVTPKYQLIDIVDADGDGRGELLFRRTSDQGSSFGVYRVGADRLWPLYEGTPQ